MDVISDPMKLCMYVQTLSRSFHEHTRNVSPFRNELPIFPEVQSYCSYIEVITIVLMHHQSHHKPNRVASLDYAGRLTLSNHFSKTIGKNPSS